MQDKLISESDAIAFSQVYEILAGMKRNVDALLHEAKKPGSTLDDLRIGMTKIVNSAEDLELAFLQDTEYDESDDDYLELDLDEEEVDD